MSDNFYINVISIVLIQSFLLFLYNLIINKKKKENDTLDEKLQTVLAILKSSKHDKIMSLSKIKEIELQSKDIYVFAKSMFRDVRNDGQFANTSNNVGTFYKTVHKNLSDESMRYTYFLKKDSHWKHFVHSFRISYSKIEGLDNKVSFCMVPAQKYFFYDEVYLYKFENEYRAFEYLPSISDEKEEFLYYLELGEKQVKRLEIIKDELIKIYPQNKLSDLL